MTHTHPWDDENRISESSYQIDFDRWQVAVIPEYEGLRVWIHDEREATRNANLLYKDNWDPEDVTRRTAEWFRRQLKEATMRGKVFPEPRQAM